MFRIILFLSFWSNVLIFANPVSGLPDFVTNMSLEIRLSDHCGKISRGVDLHMTVNDAAAYRSIRLISASGTELLNSATHPENWSVGTVPNSVYVMGRSPDLDHVDVGTYLIEITDRFGQIHTVQPKVFQADVMQTLPEVHQSCGDTIEHGTSQVSWNSFAGNTGFSQRDRTIFMSTNNGGYYYDSSGNMTQFFFNSNPGPLSFSVLYEFYRPTCFDRLEVFSSSERAVDLLVH